MKWKRRIASILVLCLVFSVGDVKAGEGYGAAQSLTENNQLIKRGLNTIDSFDAVEITQAEAERIPSYENKLVKSKAISVNGYGGTYGYSLLETEQERDAYNRLKEACQIFNNSNDNAEEITYTSGTKGYLAFRVSLGDLELEKERAGAVIVSLIYDNPQFFWTKGYSYSYRQSTNSVVEICLACSDDYSNGEERMILKEKIEGTIEDYLDKVVGLETDYEKELVLHDALAENLNYAYDSSGEPEQERWAHTIVGAFDKTHNSVVCEGYAKAFQLLLNACGIENIYIVGDAKAGSSWGGHAWNQVKIEGQWYNVDLTWNDGNYSYTHKYFNVPDSSFASTHKSYGQEDAVVGLWCYPVKNCTETLYSYENQGPLKETEKCKVFYQQPEKGKLIVLNQGIEVINGASVKKGCILEVVYWLENIEYTILVQYFGGQGEQIEPFYEIKKENQTGEVKIPLVTEMESVTIVADIETGTQTIQPVETPEVSETPGEGVTQIPAETLKPAETLAPIETLVATQAPVETERPSQTPTITLTPIETERPSQTPTVTQTPLETEKSSEAPTMSPDLQETKYPIRTEEPTKRPIETQQPTAKPNSIETTYVDDQKINALAKKVKFENISIYQGNNKKISVMRPFSIIKVHTIKDSQFGKKINGAYFMQLSFCSQNTNIAMVDARTGLVTGRKSGDTNIIVTALYSNGYSRKYIIKVKIKKPYLKLNRTQLSLKRKKTAKLSIKKYGTKGNVTWYSSNRKIAYVNKKTGKIIGRRKGTVYIYGQVGGLRVKCKVKVR